MFAHILAFSEYRGASTVVHCGTNTGMEEGMDFTPDRVRWPHLYAIGAVCVNDVHVLCVATAWFAK